MKMLIVILISLMTISCKEVKQEYIVEYKEPVYKEIKTPIRQVSISFDDGVALDSIYEHTYLFKRYNASFTYYVNYNRKLSDKTKLLDMQSRGYEIGHHGTLHKSALQYSIDNGIDQWFHDEVLLSLEQMRNDGLTITTFAYPFGSRNEETDNLLFNEFDKIRGFSTDTTLNYTPQNKNELIIAYSIDSHIIDLNKIYDAMDNLKDGETLFIATHVVGEWHNDWKISTADLEAILSYGDSTNITFCAVSDC
jgi:peptidoglycan/xylan/chitin deacetylase (PgdA/CDA1 family)